MFTAIVPGYNLVHSILLSGRRPRRSCLEVDWSRFFLYGFYRWFRSAANLGDENKSLGQAFLLLMPLSLTSFNNGQVNLLMMGGILLGLALVLEENIFGRGVH